MKGVKEKGEKSFVFPLKSVKGEKEKVPLLLFTAANTTGLKYLQIARVQFNLFFTSALKGNNKCVNAMPVKYELVGLETIFPTHNKLYTHTTE